MVMLSKLRNWDVSRNCELQLAIFLLAFLVLTGAWMGFWAVRKLVLTEDGSIDISTSNFVAWSIRILAAVMILQVSFHWSQKYQILIPHICVYIANHDLVYCIWVFHSWTKGNHLDKYVLLSEFCGSSTGSRSFDIWNNDLFIIVENF